MSYVSLRCQSCQSWRGIMAELKASCDEDIFVFGFGWVNGIVKMDVSTQNLAKIRILFKNLGKLRKTWKRNPSLNNAIYRRLLVETFLFTFSYTRQHISLCSNVTLEIFVCCLDFRLEINNFHCFHRQCESVSVFIEFTIQTNFICLPENSRKRKSQTFESIMKCQQDVVSRTLNRTIIFPC